MVRCTIWYHLYNLKNVKNTHGGVLLLIKLQAVSRFLNCTNGTKSRNASHSVLSFSIWQGKYFNNVATSVINNFIGLTKILDNSLWKTVSSISYHSYVVKYRMTSPIKVSKTFFLQICSAYTSFDSLWQTQQVFIKNVCPEKLW